MNGAGTLSPEVLGLDELEALFGPGVMVELAGPDPYESVALPELAELAEIARRERLIAMLQGEQLVAMAAFVHAEDAIGMRDSAFAEIALCLGVAHRTADARVGERVGSRRALARDPAFVVRG
jgi:hypothetical protein